MTKWPKVVLEKWALGWSRAPYTVLKAFIDAGLCSDQEPAREETRLSPAQGIAARSDETRSGSAGGDAP